MTRPPFLPPTPPDTPTPKKLRPLRRPGILLLAIGTVALPACDDAGEDHRVVGYVDLTGHLTNNEPQVPETATASVPMPITLWTTGGGCHWRGDTEVSVDGRSAVVTPYDFVRVGDFACPSILAFFEHRTTVVFDEPGTAQIVVRYSTGERFPPHDHDGAGRKVYTVEVEPAG